MCVIFTLNRSFYPSTSVWGMLYADDAGIVSKSAEGPAKMMTVIVTVFEAAGLTVSDQKTETMLLRTLEIRDRLLHSS